MNVNIYLTRDGLAKYPSATKHHLWLGKPVLDKENENFISAGSPAKQLCSVDDEIIALADVEIKPGECFLVDEVRIDLDLITPVEEALSDVLDEDNLS